VILNLIIFFSRFAISAFFITFATAYFHLPVWISYISGIIYANILVVRDLALLKASMEKK